jgi:hypothetical protein
MGESQTFCFGDKKYISGNRGWEKIIIVFGKKEQK